APVARVRRLLHQEPPEHAGVRRQGRRGAALRGEPRHHHGSAVHVAARPLARGEARPAPPSPETPPLMTRRLLLSPLAPLGDAALRGYRVYRNGAPLKQVGGTAIDVALSNNRTYRLNVAAIDGNGQLSDRSDTVSLESGHTAPPAPTGVTAVASGEASVDLA